MKLEKNINNLYRPKDIVKFSLVMIILAIISFNFFDQPITEWTYINTRDAGLSVIFKNATYLQPLYYTLSPWVIFYIIYNVYNNKVLSETHRLLILMIFSMSVTLLFNEELRFIFGRYWPATWFHGNLSWIDHKAYGFTWFKFKHEFKSFPSGHSALIFGLMMVPFYLCKNKKIKAFCLLNCFAVILGLLLMTYHFLSDILIGSLVGIVISYLITYSYLKLCSNQK